MAGATTSKLTGTREEAAEQLPQINNWLKERNGRHSSRNAAWKMGGHRGLAPSPASPRGFFFCSYSDSTITPIILRTNLEHLRAERAFLARGPKVSRQNFLQAPHRIRSEFAQRVQDRCFAPDLSPLKVDHRLLEKAGTRTYPVCHRSMTIRSLATALGILADPALGLF
jgi:hypothetical protein